MDLNYVTVEYTTIKACLSLLDGRSARLATPQHHEKCHLQRKTLPIPREVIFTGNIRSPQTWLHLMVFLGYLLVMILHCKFPFHCEFYKAGSILTHGRQNSLDF